MRRKLVRKANQLRENWNEEFYEVIEDLAEHPVVLEMKKYPHHCATDCYRHCMNVAYYNYRLCRLFGLDAKSAARGGMLHDLFLYNWHTHTKETGDHFHAMTHPGQALKNARKHFRLNRVEEDVIARHMWPVTFLRLPRTFEGFIATWTDKYCGICEITDYYSSRVLPVKQHFR